MIPLTTVAMMRAADAATIAGGIPGRELMRRAARGIFENYPWKGKTAIVCGSGNNAGDGYALALCLRFAGIACDLILLEDRFSEDGAYYYAQCTEHGIRSISYHTPFDFSEYEEIVDCIFGTGFSGTVQRIAAEAIRDINRSGKHVISADINSGLNGDNGLGTLCVRSDLTVAIGCCKTGHFLNGAKDAIGSVHAVDIGISVPDSNIYLMTGQDFRGIFPKRAQLSHKGDYGYVTVLGGSAEYSGAVKLANLSASALRAGCGVAQLAVPQSIANAVAPYLLESTLLPIPSDESGHMCYCPDCLDAILAHRAALAVGMGWGHGAEHAKILSHILKNGSLQVVIDADGLNTLSEMGTEILSQTNCRVVLTPHLKEFERLSGVPMSEILSDPIQHAKAFAKQHGICLLLKGSCTVVTDGELVYLVNCGCAGMATAGSGDVLSGILVGLLGYLPLSPLTVACGAYLAGRAGELAEKDLNPVSMLASDTVSHITQAVGELL